MTDEAPEQAKPGSTPEQHAEGGAQSAQPAAAKSAHDRAPAPAGGNRPLHESWWRRLFGRRG